MIRKFLMIGVMVMGLFTQVVNAEQHIGDFTFDALMGGDPISLSDYKGKVVMVVNTASQCGFTGQYEGLESLYQQYKDKGLVLIGVPSNDFGGQEPGSHEEIAEFCKLNYGVSFPMAAKYQVKGEGAHPFYKFAHKVLGFGSAPKWNFHKYIIDKNGKLIDFFYTSTKPNAPKVIKVIETALNQKNFSNNPPNIEIVE